MQYIQVDKLKGEEILAVPIVTSSDIILLHSDTVLKKEYINKLMELGIQHVYIKDNIAPVDKNYNSIEETKNESLCIMKDVLDHHIYKHNQELKKIVEVAEKILESVISTPEILNEITEIKNISTDMYSHLINVCTLSTIIALSLKLKEKQVKDIAVGAILHDIGLKYITVPYNTVNLQDDNYKNILEYKKHTVYGYTALQEAEWLSDTSKEIILMHHERVNGTGYPFQKTGDKLKQEIKIVSVCDEFDNLISGMGNEKMKIYKAIEYLKVSAGTMYDTKIANSLIESIAVYPIGTQVITNEGELGIVIKQNKSVTNRPVIKMLKHSDGSKYKQEEIKDLMKILTLFIVDTIE